ncbi:hypothetical protein SD70_22645 [Gordoniibacillus kamchatkensis]|uniref:DUF2306 domain-containing protein n=1 Tax=Gordoniibacillus kamchatkensis TaxID=1590651 RepID=A0ABR5AF57_9BACL|nr:DUF2306 domain-containing protein [Paenibacillus sp. VKM B-2647]KIL39027.1 hypothetical protein SD70_22645 [Paenibacillus sp. VKM B-2647]
MVRTKKAYLLMVSVVMIFIVYVLYHNFVQDPQAAEFLHLKTDLKRTLHVDAWLTVMRIHVVFACLSMVAGAANFSAWIRMKYPKLHRMIGYLYLMCVLIVVVTSGYMAPYATGGKASSMAFNLLNIIWAAFTIVAIVKIKKKQVLSHRKWMTRSYAFVFTNLAIHLLTSLFHGGFGLAYTDSYKIAVYGSIVLLIFLAELVIRIVYKKA